MGKITKINLWHPNDEAKEKREGYYYIQIDGKDCWVDNKDGKKVKFKIRERTFGGLGIKEGDDFTCEQLVKHEKEVWKKSHSHNWDLEPIRIAKVKEVLNSKFPGLIQIRETGFGTGSQDMIEGHSGKDNKIDLSILKNGSESPVFYVEVTGTQKTGITEYWVQKEKIKYVQSNKDKRIWIALVYPDKIVYVFPNPSKEYKEIRVNINNNTEIFIEFKEGAQEVRSENEFLEDVKAFLGI